jgi:hypothetical protein
MCVDSSSSQASLKQSKFFDQPTHYQFGRSFGCF